MESALTGPRAKYAFSILTINLSTIIIPILELKKVRHKGEVPCPRSFTWMEGPGFEICLVATLKYFSSSKYLLSRKSWQTNECERRRS